MNHDEAADLRDELNGLDNVEGPKDNMTSAVFRYARIVQPGFTNGDPDYGVVLDTVQRKGSFPHLPADVLDVITDADPDFYIRIDVEERQFMVRGPPQ